MSDLLNRIESLSKELDSYPIEDCDPYDSEMESAYVQDFRNLSIRFLSSVKRVEDQSLSKMLADLDLDISFLDDVHRLKAELQGIIDYLSDTFFSGKRKLIGHVDLSPEVSRNLTRLLTDTLYDVSANILPKVCEGFGLKEGTVSEAFQSKTNYIRSRLVPLEGQEIFDLSLKVSEKFENEELSYLISEIRENNGLSVISKFNEIKALLVDEIRRAKYTIWVAVAWFTDRDLANELYLKSLEGINVQIILNDDQNNSKLKKKLDEYFEVYWILPKQLMRRMHNKFCVIDLDTVIHGSYNWTNNAQYNDETVSVIKGIREAKGFADEFISLKRSCLRST